MVNLATHDFGEYVAFCVPEPDDVITHHWGDAMTENIARTTRTWSFIGTLSDSSAGSIMFLNYSIARFTKIPFIRVLHRDSGVWSDRNFAGYYNVPQGNNSSGNVRPTSILFAGTGVALIDTGSFPSFMSNVTLSVIAYGN